MEFLKGGKLFNAVSGAVADMMDIVDATSDPIESFFGTHDLVGATQKLQQHAFPRRKK